MPYTLITSGEDEGKYRSDKGTVVTKEQKHLYYATDGFDPKKLARYRNRKKKKKSN